MRHKGHTSEFVYAKDLCCAFYIKGLIWLSNRDLNRESEDIFNFKKMTTNLYVGISYMNLKIVLDSCRVSNAKEKWLVIRS